MRLLLYSWNANNEQILADNLRTLGFEVVWFHKTCRHYTRDMELAIEMIPYIHSQRAEAVVSFNYFPIISMICDTCQIPYYAWVFDCPHFTLYAKQITLPCNHIGIFDAEMVRRLKECGVDTVYHVPLAVDTAYFDEVIEHASERKSGRYQCDISFVGSLYTDEHNYYDMLFHEEYDGIYSAIRRQCFSYQKDYLRQAVADGNINLYSIQEKMEKEGLMLGEDYLFKPEDILLAAVLEKKVTVEERKVLLTEIVKRFTCLMEDVKEERDRSSGIGKKHDFRLYTGSDTKALSELNACNRGRVDYHTQMPLVFAGSRINLNISLRSIHSGIPLRVLDIMGCGGFVLSNWQPEISEYFEEGTEIVTFNTMEDCLDKIAYYLVHDEERKQIAMNGRNRVRQMFSYQKGMEKLLC